MHATQESPLDATRQDVSLLTQVLDEIDCGLLLLTRDGQLCQANRVAARRWLAARELELSELGCVRACHPADQTRLAAGLAGAAAGRRSLVTLTREGAPLTLACVPLRPDADAPMAPAVLLVCGRPACGGMLAMEFFACAHSLTLAETAVLRALADGASPADMAQASGVAISTVRTHIGALRSKTGTHSIAELLRQLAALPPVACAAPMLH